MTTGSTTEAAEADHNADLDAVMLTDVGMVREHNEDCALIDPEHSFFIVADGMGGHAAGEVASAMAVDTVRQELEVHRKAMKAFAQSPTESGRRQLVRLLQSSVHAAHQSVFQRGTAEPDKHGMGTTLDVVLFAGAEAFVAHVGDSRTYLLRDGKLAQITTDHTVAEVLVIEGKLSVEEAQVSPLRTMLVNALGVSAEVGVEMAHLQLQVGDRIMLCSDGLHDYFLEELELAEQIGGGPITSQLQGMIDIAKERGGHDNITGIVIEVRSLPTAIIPAPMERDPTRPIATIEPDPDWESDHTEASATASPRDREILSVRERNETVNSSVAAMFEPMVGRATELHRRVLGDADTMPPGSPSAAAEVAAAADSAKAQSCDDTTSDPASADDSSGATTDAVTTLSGSGRKRVRTSTKPRGSKS